MRNAWDRIAKLDENLYVGDPRRARDEVMGLFGRLGADPRGGTCVEVGCGAGRMTIHLAERFDEVVAVDVSSRMIAKARERIAAQRLENVVFVETGGTDLAPLASDSADWIVCYLVLQHLPRRRVLAGYVAEFARILRPGGEAFVQLPVLNRGLAARLWQLVRSIGVPVSAAFARSPTSSASFRGYRPTWGEVQGMLHASELEDVGRDEAARSPYRFSHEVFLRLRSRV
jgi:ubiquinone/menaquinone biosynthesis C-methylase UbiE